MIAQSPHLPDKTAGISTFDSLRSGCCGFTGPVTSAALDKVMKVLYTFVGNMSIGNCMNATIFCTKQMSLLFRKLICHDIGIIGDLII